MVTLQNRKMLQQLNVLIAISLAKSSQQNTLDYDDYEQIQEEILLVIVQQVILTTNFWLATSLVNVSLGLVETIVYARDAKLPDLPEYVVVNFPNYISPTWDQDNPRAILIPPITWGSQR